MDKEGVVFLDMVGKVFGLDVFEGIEGKDEVFERGVLIEEFILELSSFFDVGVVVFEDGFFDGFDFGLKLSETLFVEGLFFLLFEGLEVLGLGSEEGFVVGEAFELESGLHDVLLELVVAFSLLLLI